MNPGDIKISANFAVSTEQFIDGRMTVANVAALSAFEFVPDGFETFVRSENTWYVYNKAGNSWSPRPNSSMISLTVTAFQEMITEGSQQNNVWYQVTNAVGNTRTLMIVYGSISVDGVIAYDVRSGEIGRWKWTDDSWKPVGSGSQDLQSVTDVGNVTDQNIVVSQEPDLSECIAAIGYGELDGEDAAYVSLHNKDNVQGLITNRLMENPVNFDLPNTNNEEPSRVIPISVNGAYADENGNVNADGCLTYTALLTQTGTDAPTAIVLKNTLGETPTFQYNTPGNYSLLTSGTIFTANKTFFISSFSGGLSYDLVALARISNTEVIIELDSGNDTQLNNAPIEIRVYP